MLPIYKYTWIKLEYTYIMGFYDEVEIEDMDFDEDEKIYFYPCPCGDRFRITLEDLEDGENIAKCPSCTLYIRVIGVDYS